MSLPQPGKWATSTPWIRIYNFVECRKLFLTLNHQNILVEWPTFEQKGHSLSRPSTHLSLWTRTSLPQPGTWATSTHWIRIDNFGKSRKLFLTMNHPNILVEWPPFDQKGHSVSRPSTPLSLWIRTSLSQPGTWNTSTPWIRIDNFVKSRKLFLTMNHQNILVEWPPIDQKGHSLSRPSTPCLV